MWQYLSNCNIDSGKAKGLLHNLGNVLNMDSMFICIIMYVKGCFDGDFRLGIEFYLINPKLQVIKSF